MGFNGSNVLNEISPNIPSNYANSDMKENSADPLKLEFSAPETRKSVAIILPRGTLIVDDEGKSEMNKIPELDDEDNYSVKNN